MNDKTNLTIVHSFINKKPKKTLIIIQENQARTSKLLPCLPLGNIFSLKARNFLLAYVPPRTILHAASLVYTRCEVGSQLCDYIYRA